MPNRFSGPTAATVAVMLMPVLLAPDDALMITDESTSSASTWSDQLSTWGISANGYVAASYYASNGYPFNIHQCDVRHNTFQLDQAGFSMAYQPKQGFGAVVDLIAVEDARILNTAEGSHGRVFDVLQAYVQFVTGPIAVIAGKFLTLAGARGHRSNGQH